MVAWTQSDLTRVLAVATVLALISVVTLGLTSTPTSDSYTEFYVLGPDGSASEYPTDLSVSESGTVRVGLSNHEGASATYTVVLRLGGERVAARSVSLRQGQTWEQNFSFTPDSPGSKKLQILLYDGESIDGTSEPRQRLRLWIDVTKASAQSSLRVGGGSE